MCDRCGLPFEYDAGPDAVCGACAANAPAYRQARAVLAYDDGSRELLLPFKHADRIDAAPTFGGWLARAGARLLAEADIVTPVPLHRWRLFRRRYNQSALLALAAGRVAGRPVLPDLLKRTRRTRSQGGLSRKQRTRNVQGAFAVPERSRPAVRDRAVVLVDDVLTTGATVTACSRVLLRAGAARVDVLTLARVVRTNSGPV